MLSSAGPALHPQCKGGRKRSREGGRKNKRERKGVIEGGSNMEGESENKRDIISRH